MTLKLTLHTAPEAPVEAPTLRPDALAGLGLAEIAALPVLHGSRPAALGDFFRASGTAGEALCLEGDLSRFKWIGHQMDGGHLRVAGPVGCHVGAEMRGGVLEVEGDAGDWAGAEMTGGRLIIRGNAGHSLGGTYPGSRMGMQGGEIIVHGRASHEAGRGMRRGLIAIGGDCGDFAGVDFRAGTLVVLGALGARPGAGMRRGTLVALAGAQPLPTFNFACVYRPVFLRLYLRHLRELGLPITDAHVSGRYARWSGDMLDLGRGELLIWESD